MDVYLEKLMFCLGNWRKHVIHIHSVFFYVTATSMVALIAWFPVYCAVSKSESLSHVLGLCGPV